MLALLLILGLSSGCTIRLELASPRLTQGDLSASSAGLAGHERWFAWTPAGAEPQTSNVIALATVAPGDLRSGPVQLLPGVGTASLAGVSHNPPRPALRPEDGSAWLRVAHPPPPPKPLRVAAAGRSGSTALGGVAAHAGRLVRPASALRFTPDEHVAPTGPVRRRQALVIRAFEPAARRSAITLAPGLELAGPDSRFELAWLMMTRRTAAKSAAGSETFKGRPSTSSFGESDDRSVPVRLFRRSAAPS